MVFYFRGLFQSHRRGDAFLHLVACHIHVVRGVVKARQHTLFIGTLWKQLSASPKRAMAGREMKFPFLPCVPRFGVENEAKTIFRRNGLTKVAFLISSCLFVLAFVFQLTTYDDDGLPRAPPPPPVFPPTGADIGRRFCCCSSICRVSKGLLFVLPAPPPF